MDDILVVFIEIALAVQSLDKTGIVAERIAHGLADTGHDIHIQHHIDRVGQLEAILGKRRADDRHGVGDDVHRATLVGAVCQRVHALVHLLGVHPVVGRACVLLALTADEGAVLDARDVVGVGAVEIAARKLVRVELDESTVPDRLLAQLVQLVLFTRDPDDAVRLGDGGHFVDPGQNGLVVCQICHLFFPRSIHGIIEKFLCRVLCGVLCPLARQGANRCTGKKVAIEFSFLL